MLFYVSPVHAGVIISFGVTSVKMCRFLTFPWIALMAKIETAGFFLHKRLLIFLTAALRGLVQWRTTF